MPASIDPVAAALADLAIIVVVARLVGTLFVRLRQPRVVGEMVAGILIGPTVLGAGATQLVFPAVSQAFLGLFGTLALVLFTFLVGVEVPQHLLRGRLGRVGLIGVAVAATALPVISRILQERGLVATTAGALGLGVAAVVTPLTFVVLGSGAAVRAGTDPFVTTRVQLALVAALVAVLLLVVRPLLAAVLARHFGGADLGGGTLALLLAGALLTAVATDRIGVQALPGGLLFGAAVPQVPGLARAVADRLQPVVVVVGIPVFLAVSGLQTDLRLLRAEHLGAVALFLAAVAVAKCGVGAGVGRLAGLPGRDAAVVGVLLSCGGLVTLVVALAARQLGLITPAMQAVFVVAAIVTTLATGPLLSRFSRRASPG